MGTIVGSAVNPLTLTPALWIDFSDASTVTTVSGNISQVTDKSGNGLTFTQGTGVNRPSYPSSVLNGRSVARFDGANDILFRGSSNLGRNISGATIYSLQRPDVLNNAATNQGIFSVSNNGSVNRLYAYLSATNGYALAGGRTLDADSFNSASSNPLTASTANFEIYVSRFDYANTDLFLYNGTTLIGSTTSYQSATTTSNTASSAAAIGATVGGGQPFDGDIAEILVFHTAHDAATRQRVCSYLRNKWAI